MKHITAIALALVVSFGLAANAASVTHTSITTETGVTQTTPDVRTITVPKFDGSAGTLTGVAVTYKVTVTDRFGVENINLSQSCSGIARATWAAALKADGVPVAAVVIQDAVAESVSQYDGVFDSGGISGCLETPKTLTKTATVAPNWVQFRGSGNLTLTSEAGVKHSFTKANGLGTPIPTNLFKVSVEVSVTYTYNPI